jgi:hypothetical protein
MKAIIRGLVLGLLTVSTFAYPDYEPFNYPVGVNLVGQTSPDLLTWTAAGPPGLNVVVQAGNLTVPGLAAPAGNQVLVRGAPGPSARFPIGPTINTGTVFFSFALRVGSLGQLGSAGDFLAGFNDAVGTQSTTPTVVGTRVLTRPARDGYNLGLDKSSGVPDNYKWDPRVFTVKDTVFIVGSYTFAAATADVARLWINPDPATFGAGAPPPETFNTAAGSDLKQIASFIFFQRPGGVQPEESFADELRIGGTWESVTPPVVPPPDNDQCGGAIALTACDSYTMNTANATDTADPIPTCQTKFGKGVWFTYTPSVTALVTVSTCGSGFDTVLQVYTGSCQALTPLAGACNDNDGPVCPGPQASLTFNGVANTDYYFLVGGFSGAGGNLQVRVLDTTPPTVTCPKDIVADTDPGQCSKSNVTFVATATDNCPVVTVTCEPPSGSTFAKGVTTVVCTATDASGNTNRCSFTVTILDKEPPHLSCPPDKIVFTTNTAGEYVRFVAVATDRCDISTVWCEPPSGSFFPIGTTLVVCTACDASSNCTSCSFTVTVKPGSGLETDRFPNSLALVELCWPTGQTEKLTLSGPTTVTVSLGPLGECNDTDGDGRDQAATEMTQLELSGLSPTLGPVTLALRNLAQCPFRRTLGELEEQANATPGILDVQPFASTGWCDSFFDVFFEVRVAGRVFHNHQPKRMQAMIDYKPPATGTAYEDPTPVLLYDEAEQPTGISLCATRHIPQPQPPEIDVFTNTLAGLELTLPDGRTETLSLQGPTRVRVDIPPTGQATDTDGDGRDQVASEIIQMELTGHSPLLGPVVLRLRDPNEHPFRHSAGQIEELANNTAGILDVPPFTATGQAESFFDVFFEVEVAGIVLHNEVPKRMRTIIAHKPPEPGATYEDPQVIELLNENNLPTGVRVGRAGHTPNPPGPEIDYFPNTVASIQLQLPTGTTETIALTGPTTVHVSIGPAGQASDGDGDGRDEAPSEITQLELAGMSSVGPVKLHLRDATKHPFRRSLGQIEERVNNTAGILDVPPFTPAGTADSFFDVFVEVEVPGLGLVLHNAVPKHMHTVITHKPPQPGATYEDPQPIDLLDEQGNVTGVRLVRTGHTPNPTIEIDTFPYTLAGLRIELLSGATFPVDLAGPTVVQVNIPPNGAASDTDGDGRDQVATEMLSMNLAGSSIMGPVQMRLDPAHRTLGQVEEQVNNTPGTLDLPPFTGIGQADSFFDVFAEVIVASNVFHMTAPVRMASVITHKPPAPGDTYQPPAGERTPLYDGNGRLVGWLVHATHTPNPPAELDSFATSQATLTLELPGGLSETVQLTGPSQWRVDLPSDGHALDTDGDGRDQVTTELTQLDLAGVSSLGPVQLRLNPLHGSCGQIEERVNNTPGTLDLPPFTATGAADSFFDVFAEVVIGTAVFHPVQPLRLYSLIMQKPPCRGETYTNTVRYPLPLLDANGRPSGIRLTGETYTPCPTQEIDTFFYTLAGVSIELLNGAKVPVNLAGPTVVQVNVPPSGAASDTDGDGRDQVATEMLSMNLAGSSALGRVGLRLDPAHRTFGEIEEQANNTRGVLDLPPFRQEGFADSFFDVFVEVSIDSNVFRLPEPIRMVSVISHKPPGPGETYAPQGQQRIPLTDQSGKVMGWLVHASHTPNPPTEIDYFPRAELSLSLQTPAGAPLNVVLRGPVTLEVFVPPNGAAADTDGDGRDQAPARITQLNLGGDCPLGPVITRLSAYLPSLGGLEEQANNTPGILDVPPFTPTGHVDSFFDVFWEFELGGSVMQPTQPIRLAAVLPHKPPPAGVSFRNPPMQPVPLVNRFGFPTGFFLLDEVLTLTPLSCPDLDVTLDRAGQVRICWPDDGGNCVLQWTGDLAVPMQWQKADLPVVTQPDGSKCVTITVPAKRAFFRLCGGCR